NRISQAKVQPIGRADVPAALERILAKAMSRNPSARPGSVLEVVRELQSIESELGLVQTPIEVAMDDWALATVADLEDRTKVRGVAGAVTGSGKRRRRRSAQATSFASVGTLHRPSDGGARTLSRISAQRKGIKLLALGTVVIAMLVLALGITATFVIIRAGDTGIPTVSGIQATQVQNGIEFTWGDPGIAPEDRYQGCLL